MPKSSLIKNEKNNTGKASEIPLAVNNLDNLFL